MADNENTGPDPSHLGDAIAYTLGTVRPTFPELAEAQRRAWERFYAQIPPMPADAVGYIIGVDPASPEGDVSVRFLSSKEFYID